MVRLKGSFSCVAVYGSLVIFTYLFVAKPSSRPPTDLLDDLEINCTNILQGLKNEKQLELINTKMIEDKLWNSTDRCHTVKSMFRFNEVPLSEEEARFPLSYGLLVYKELSQVLFMLSSIYQPQNEYCIAVGENSASTFLILLEELSDCFPNVHFMKRPPITWGSYEIINSVYDCLKFLSHLKSNWKYFQYLSGVDIPLKTNLEMVRILKSLNGTANVEIKVYENRRLLGQNETESPLPLFKSSLSSLIPRKAANYLASSSIPQQLLEFLRNTWVADEGFWGTLFGNKGLFDVPGSLNFEEWIYFKENARANLTKPTDGWFYYISRHQIWFESGCHNHMKDGSCVFGIGDVSNLLQAKALVAHKLYLTSEPEAYFCLLKEHRRRTLNPDSTFDASKYSELPQVEISQDRPVSELTHLNWIL
ncbi:GLYcosylation related [Caenorhabditis elegans]|uniref:GLY-16 n=1 Tax=Caenorhabditis elegans TaxID=6239 RepID=G5EDP7_CAEEL|nr:GLYcosylation related [Caenorhabditis elegans]AAK94760.1 GLY-16 [Caenorhabditis elegans]CAB05620.2 GLYcosylation related [Caenorhabditis elegans]|eukprot:NP_493135.2 GLYcosylation related [Caenorhabditis elegans]